MERSVKRIKLSDMQPGDTGYLPSEGAFVVLVEDASQLWGNARRRRRLELIDANELRPADWYPTIDQDTDEVSL